LYRLGANLFQLPVNRPLAPVNNHNQNGVSNNAQAANGDVNYEPSRQLELAEDTQFKAVETKLAGTVQQKAISNPRNFYQAGVLYRSMNEQDKKDLIANLAGDLNKVMDKDVKATMVSYFYRADKEYGTRLAKATDTNLSQVKNKAMM
ncbi:catalase-related domain-containing protein, partial [Vibrio campbellii]